MEKRDIDNAFLIAEELEKLDATDRRLVYTYISALRDRQEYIKSKGEKAEKQ